MGKQYVSNPSRLRAHALAQKQNRGVYEFFKRFGVDVREVRADGLWQVYYYLNYWIDPQNLKWTLPARKHRAISWHKADNLPELLLALRQCAKDYYQARESWELRQYRKTLDKQWLNSGD